MKDFRQAEVTFNGDILLKFDLSNKGKFKYLNDIKPAIHRHHNGGVWSKKNEYYKLSNKLKNTWDNN